MRGAPTHQKTPKKAPTKKKRLPEDSGAAKIKLEPERFSQQSGERDRTLNRGDTESLKGTTVYESLDSFLHVH